jgi:hypothetical protein
MRIRTPMIRLKMGFFTKLLKAKSCIFILVIVFFTCLLSAFDVCWFFVNEGVTDNGFVFGSSWNEHLHSSEGWTIYHQVEALNEGRIWLSRDAPPDFSADFIRIGNYYYAPFEPLVAILLLPFYALGEALVGVGYLIRSVLVGMIFYTGVCALLLRRICLHLGNSPILANFAALIFALATMAFSYSRLIYPQPIFTMFALMTLLFLFRYMKNRNRNDLFFLSLVFGLALNTFNAFVIALPFMLYYITKTGFFRKKENLLNIGLGLLPGILLFVSWNFAVTRNPFMTPRQLVHSSIDFEVLYLTAGGMGLNFGGLFGSLFSPIGIFFVSPILLAAFVGFLPLRQKARNETVLLVSLIIIFWLFNSFANLGGAAGRDFWVGGWANIARYMYLPSTLLVILAIEGVAKINRSRNLIGTWIISITTIISLLANFTYGVRHDLMVTHPQDFATNALMIWPHPLAPLDLTLFSIAVFFASIIHPFYLIVKKVQAQRSDLDSDLFGVNGR